MSVNVDNHCSGLKQSDESENKEGQFSWPWTKELAFRTYDLTVDQIMELVEKVGPEGEITWTNNTAVLSFGSYVCTHMYRAQ